MALLLLPTVVMACGPSEPPLQIRHVRQETLRVPDGGCLLSAAPDVFQGEESLWCAWSCWDNLDSNTYTVIARMGSDAPAWVLDSGLENSYLRFPSVGRVGDQWFTLAATGVGLFIFSSSTLNEAPRQVAKIIPPSVLPVLDQVTLFSEDEILCLHAERAQSYNRLELSRILGDGMAESQVLREVPVSAPLGAVGVGAAVREIGGVPAVALWDVCPGSDDYRLVYIPDVQSQSQSEEIIRIAGADDWVFAGGIGLFETSDGTVYLGAEINDGDPEDGDRLVIFRRRGSEWMQIHSINDSHRADEDCFRSCALEMLNPEEILVIAADQINVSHIEAYGYALNTTNQTLTMLSSEEGEASPLLRIAGRDSTDRLFSTIDVEVTGMNEFVLAGTDRKYLSIVRFWIDEE